MAVSESGNTTVCPNCGYEYWVWEECPMCISQQKGEELSVLIVVRKSSH